MIRYLIALLILNAPFFSWAQSLCDTEDQLKASFTALLRPEKGPFGKNVRQGSNDRIDIEDILSGRRASPRSAYFDAAFRTDFAQRLARNCGLFTGNLFTTNYYELIGEFVHNNAYGNHTAGPQEDQALLDRARNPATQVNIMSRADSMVRNWVLEKYHISHFPDGKLARAFQFRGIAGVEFEAPFAKRFFNFYLSAMTEEAQFLIAFMLLRESPIGNDNQDLRYARDQIDVVYKYFKDQWGERDARVQRLWLLRNAIHNQLTRNVIAMIDRYLIDHPWYNRANGHSVLFQIKDRLLRYFSFQPDVIVQQAQRLNQASIAAAAQTLLNSGGPLSPDILLDLARSGAQLRKNFARLSTAQRAEAMSLLDQISRYISKEIEGLVSFQSEALEALIHGAYLEGFLYQDSWEYFVGESKKVRDAVEAQRFLDQVLAVAGDAVLDSQRFGALPHQSTLHSWSVIEPKMAEFLDDTLKSSPALNTINILIQKWK